RRLSPTAGGVALAARPSWIEVAPESKAAVHGYEPGGTAGQCTGGQYRAWVALPGCQLVAEIDLTATTPVDGVVPAQVVRALRVTRDGVEVVSDVSTLRCPAE